jgi:hypothetical protein
LFVFEAQLHYKNHSSPREQVREITKILKWKYL